jgi:integrase
MMQRDLDAARKKWIKEAKTESEREARERSDYLAYCNHAGRYADFHSCRHLFITSLERAGVRPKVAQTLARHSEIRLTLNVYSRTELSEQTAAIGALPGLPGVS